MQKVAVVKEIQASPVKVWDFISDIEKAPDWVVVMQSLVETSENPVKEGTVYRERSKIGLKESETTWRVTKFEEPRVQIHECNEPDFRAILTMRVEGNGNNTNLFHTTEYAILPKFRPLGWLLEKLFIHSFMVKNLSQSVENCKQVIEQNK